MLSMSVNSGIRGPLPCLSFPSQNSIVGPFKASSSLKQNPSPPPPAQKSLVISRQKSKPMKRIGRLYASATAEAEAAMDNLTDGNDLYGYDDEASTDDQEFKVEKAKLVLKFIWMEKNIGIGLDQEIKGHGRVPLSPYFFWPRKDAWEELKTTLESKPWVTQKMMIILLNQATDIINLWQQSGGSLTT